MRILIGGSGEILPYIIRQWEPWHHRIICVDLSTTSLRRARIRLALSRKPIAWVASDLDLYLENTLNRAKTGTFGHIDAFGVLHHMPCPGRTLDLIGRSLVPGGTARIMVYNSDARHWIRDFQRIFATLKIDTNLASDISFARNVVIEATRWSATLAALVGQMGSQTLNNQARFADTFLHPRECTLDGPWWLDRLRAAGLEWVGLLDRYAELDDLPNPLWETPSSSALKERSLDGRFEGNLEIYVRRPGGIKKGQDHSKNGALPQLQYARALHYGPPRFWFGFRETSSLPVATRWALWHAHLVHVLFPRRDQKQPSNNLAKIAAEAQQRLARIGAIFPDQCVTSGQKSMLHTQVSSRMDVPSRPPTSSPIPGELMSTMAQRLEQQGRYSDRRMEVICERLHRAASMDAKKNRGDLIATIKR
jgi:SAM-dependent methyltransferase